MNIKITYNWLLELLETDAGPYEIQKYLSLCGPSVERIEKIDDDYVLDIEITSNRIDTACVLGIAQECVAILPQFGKKVRLKKDPLSHKFKELAVPQSPDTSLDIEVRDSIACSRFSALVIKNINLSDSPALIQKRLKFMGERTVNSLVDISNYLMIELGQPSHIFDMDTIKDHKLILCRSRKGEKIITLDGESIILAGEDIIIKDSSKSIIDLCGIMGGQNSSVTEKTKNIIIFVQTYDKQSIRKTSMTLGKRSLAATYFEKGLDPQRVEPALVSLVNQILKYANGHIESKLYDIYPRPQKIKSIHVSYEQLTNLIGIKLPLRKIETILKSLSFNFVSKPNTSLLVTPPSWRSQDIRIWQDIAEEVARVYGYHRIDSCIQQTHTVRQPKKIDIMFATKQTIRTFLSNIGLYEVYNYSMISKNQINKLELDLAGHLRLSNTISTDIQYLRTSLMPSLLKNISDNEGKSDTLQFYEIARVYKKNANKLPHEEETLGIVTTGDFFQLKGIIEALLEKLNTTFEFVKSNEIKQMLPAIQAEILIDSTKAGYIGEIRNHLIFGKSRVFMAQLSLDALVSGAKKIPIYHPTVKYARVKFDLTYVSTQKLTFSFIKKTSFKASQLLVELSVVDRYKDNVTLRFEFELPHKNITQNQAKEELEKIKIALKL